LQISQGYIIRILQHFATKLRNITNFVMLFQAVMTCLDQNFSYKGKGPLNTRAASSWKVPEIIGTTGRRADDDRNVRIGIYSSNFKYEGQSSQFIALYANLAR
jgi:hypothetical protein